jgi:hypothetical protein
LLAAACGEDVTAPGVCPDYCPAVRIGIIDSLFSTSIERDSTYKGYVNAHEASQMQVSSGGSSESRSAIRFAAYDSLLQVGDISTELGRVVGTDSFLLRVTLTRRSGLGGMQLSIFRLPVGIDTAVTYEGLDPFFDDSTEIGTLAIPDSVTDGQLSALLPGDAFPDLLEVDSMRTAIGIAMRDSAGFADLQTINVDVLSTILTMYAQVDSMGADTVPRSQDTGPSMDTYVVSAAPPLGDTELSVGGLPAARSLLRFTLPEDVVDSSNVLRATLQLVPTQPVLGAPGDSVFLRAMAVATDVGPKSPVVDLAIDSAMGLGVVSIPVGSIDTAFIEIAHVVRGWGIAPENPRSLMLMVEQEGSSFAEFRFHSSTSAGDNPAIRITYAPPIGEGVP